MDNKVTDFLSSITHLILVVETTKFQFKDRVNDSLDILMKVLPTFKNIDTTITVLEPQAVVVVVGLYDISIMDSTRIATSLKWHGELVNYGILNRILTQALQRNEETSGVIYFGNCTSHKRFDTMVKFRSVFYEGTGVPLLNVLPRDDVNFYEGKHTSLEDFTIILQELDDSLNRIDSGNPNIRRRLLRFDEEDK